jgi:radical SAM superfamily enzyme YgiQ (UPF0313 family)
MLGLPTETDADVAAVAALSDAVVDQYYALPKEKRRRPVNISVSASFFVPKPCTPFQWEAQDTAETFVNKAKHVKSKIQKKQVTFRYHAADAAVIEGILARGDRRVGTAIEAAYRLGATFDAWTEQFKPDIWRQAFFKTGIRPEDHAHRVRGADEPLPWDFIDMGITKNFLQRERERAHAGLTSPDCLLGCAGCGLRCKS